MKKIFILLLSLPLIFIAVGCKNSGANTATTSTETKTAEKYEAVRLEVGYRQEEVAYYNEKYIPKNLYVELVYSNGIKVDVTSACIYTIDTSKVGEVDGYATYEKFSAPIKANVVVPSIIGIQLTKYEDYKIFKKGDIYNPDNVTILALYDNGNSGRITSFDYALFYSDGSAIINGMPFEQSGMYEVVFTLLMGSKRFEASYNIEVEYEPDPNTKVFEIEDNLYDTTTNCNFNEFAFSELFTCDYADIEAKGERNGIRNEIDDSLVYETYLGKPYTSCILIDTPTISTTPDSLKFIVKTDVIIKMVVNANDTFLPYLSLNDMRTEDRKFEGEIGMELTEISVSLTPGTYYLGHGISWLRIYEITIIAA